MNFLLSFILLLGSQSPIPHSTRVGDLYVDNFEVSNIHWQEYVFHRSKETNAPSRDQLTPDSSNFWFPMPEHRYKPIVLVTYDQVLDYCKWRSKVVSEKLGKKVTFRLPTKAEWQRIAQYAIENDLKMIQRELKKAKALVNKDSGQYSVTDITSTKERLGNLFDNVSEMTQERGVAMGSNNHKLMDPKEAVEQSIAYDRPHPYLGFRCVAEVE